MIKTAALEISSPYEVAWREARRRRTLALRSLAVAGGMIGVALTGSAIAAVGVALPVPSFAGALLALAALVPLGIAVAQHYRYLMFQCPRCGNEFGGAGVLVFKMLPARCAHCRLEWGGTGGTD